MQDVVGVLDVVIVAHMRSKFRFLAAKLWVMSNKGIKKKRHLTFANNNCFSSGSCWSPTFKILDADKNKVLDIKGPCCILDGPCCPCDNSFEVDFYSFL